MPRVEDLPEVIRALAVQWPAGAYPAEGEAFHQHWKGRGHRRTDWDALWAARVQDRHADVMRSAKAGVSYLAATSPAAPGAAAKTAEKALPAAAKADEDDRSAALHKALRDQMGEVLWQSWFAGTALIVDEDSLTVAAPSQFVCGWLEDRMQPKITKAVAQLGWHIDRIYFRVSAPKRRKSGEKA